MFSTVFTPSRVIAGWAAAVALIIAVSNAMGASLSTMVFMLVLCATPGIVIALLAHSAPSPSVAQILHAAEKNDRS